MPVDPNLAQPISFGREVPPESVEMSREGMQRVARLFEEQIDRGLHPGAQLVVLRHGQVVLDRARGLADVKRGLPVTPETPFLTFSVTKPYTGLCVHKLIEEGRVELDAPIAEYWPEFGCRGKERATIRHAFLHQAGIPSRGLNWQVFQWPNWERVTRGVARLAAEFEPGSRTAYHLVNYGFILGEVVRRVSGWPIELYLRRHFLNPLSLRHSWLGLPRSERPRAARLYCGHPQQRNTTLLFNVPAIRSAVVPAATLHSTAREVAIFYQMLLNEGHYAGHRYLKRETIAAATRMGYEGYDGLIRKGMRWAYGFQLGGSNPEKQIGMAGQGMGAASTERTFGHFGNASCMAWADPDAGLVVTFTCNRLLSSEESVRRWQALSDAIWAATRPG